MSVAYLGERLFHQEVAAAGRVWVAKNDYGGVHTMEVISAGVSLPVWSSGERALTYLRTARLVGPHCAPQAVPLADFIARWLHDRRLGVAELLINPDGRSLRMLVMTPPEFCAAHEAPRPE